MIKEEYKNGCRLKEQVKYNIDYDDCQILNLTCANYIYDLVQESSKYETKLEDVKKMLYMIEKLLGHEVQYDIPEYHGDDKKSALCGGGLKRGYEPDGRAAGDREAGRESGKEY